MPRTSHAATPTGDPVQMESLKFRSKFGLHFSLDIGIVNVHSCGHESDVLHRASRLCNRGEQKDIVEVVMVW